MLFSKILNDFIIPYIGYAFIWFVGKTSIVREENDPFYDRLVERGENFIYAFWHGRQLFLVYSHRQRDINILISQSRDGSYITRITDMFGFKAVRGSSSRGGAKALIDVKRRLLKGYLLAFTPDGPRGPLRKVQSGVIYAAFKTGRPIIPLTYSAKRKKIVGDWDEFWIPYPFNTILVMHGKPFYVSRNDDIEAKCVELEQVLNSLTDEADIRVKQLDKRVN